MASTYERILHHVSKAARQHANIRLNQPITNIKSSPSKDHGRYCITLTTATGETSQFDEVVVTCPLGWLKRNKSAFTPSLPPRLTQAIDSISYGRLEKVYVTFPRAFWHTPSSRSATAVTNTNTDTDTDTNGYETNHGHPTFVQFFDPTYTPHPESIPWNQEFLSLASLPPQQAHPTLLFYTYGPCATHIVSHLSTLTPSSQEYNTYLESILHPFYSRLPGYDPTSTDCKPVAFVATQWQNDAYAGNGSYCNFQVGLEQGDKDIEVLRRGLGEERGVWFAGEHTAPFVALGTTTGAYWSGERAAGQICDLYGLERNGMGVGRDDSLPSANGKGKRGVDGLVGSVVGCNGNRFG